VDGEELFYNELLQDSGHIPGAVCISNESIGPERPEELPDLDQVMASFRRRHLMSLL
jgi:hypothetical protein